MRSLTIVLTCVLISVVNVYSQDNSKDKPKTQAKVEQGISISNVQDQTYQSSPITPQIIVRDGSLTLVKDKDYTLTFQNNVDAGSASIIITGKGNYRDSQTVKFNIVPKAIALVQINTPTDQTYRGSQITPDILIKDGNKILKKDMDYTLSFSNNTNVGTATVTISGKGNYKDNKVLSFRIVAKSVKGKR